MRLSELEARLRAGLAGRLPGKRGQLRLAPTPRPGWEPGSLPEDHRPAAALLLLYPRADAAHVLLTLRHADLPLHAGQVSLPGGALEPGESIEKGALREAEEEVGLAARRVRLLGRLTPLYIPASGFGLHPVVGLADERPPLRAEPREVARLLEIDLELLRDPGRVQWENRRFDNHVLRVPFLRIEGEKLWGATAMILGELLALLD